ncbi:sigma-54-dependent transcriptional regulator [Chitinophaga agri]|uniref:Sigma-54-dependent Fis family transcriptional regulator n=1 Tax=Chitinophaga agri TaxID=2703787 RepID=A0A6B9ZKC1_9BACT|nr:sigma-54 dependent transcriptional regulator [Chitinophaga agri]QHS62880.1 sigma-54-dependent Fis family transcriptional regulator [Chitinophaga agri]
MKAKILIVEDQFIEAHALERMLLRAGYMVCDIATSVQEALAVIDKEPVDMVLLDIQLKGSLTGIDLAERLNQRNIAFVYLSANSNRTILEQAKRTQPYGFLVKPFRQKDVLIMLDVAWYLHKQKKEPLSGNIASKTANNSNRSKTGCNTPVLIGNSPAIAHLYEQIRTAAGSNISVLIQGESGTGKELVAREIHQLSDRCNKPFVVVNCAGLPATLIESELFGHERGMFTGAIDKRTGKFEQADGGTIFLDEIGELPIDIQVKFLRVLQEREIEPIGGNIKKINVRILAATNRNLENEIAHARFRLDLYYRLSVFPVNVPALREHTSDIPLLAAHFMQRYAQDAGKHFTGITDSVLKQLMHYGWPGNVRELQNVIFRSVLLNDGPEISRLSVSLPQTADSKDTSLTMEENERNHILRVLEKCGWKVAGKNGAAEILNINVSTLNSRMKKLGIKKPRWYE